MYPNYKNFPYYSYQKYAIRALYDAIAFIRFAKRDWHHSNISGFFSEYSDWFIDLFCSLYLQKNLQAYQNTVHPVRWNSTNQYQCVLYNVCCNLFIMLRELKAICVWTFSPINEFIVMNWLAKVRKIVM